jgi:ABC-type sugar transport system ATPase subunit
MSQETQARTPVIRGEQLSKSYGAIEALVRVSFEIYPGEIVGLVGDNGAGKSTLAKIISGAHAPTAGELYVEERLVSFSNPAEARAMGIETVYQHLALVDQLDAAGNLFLGRELMVESWYGRLANVLRLDEMRARAQEALDSLHIKIPDITAPVRTMSGGQRQAIAIGRSVFWGRKLLILDEPTAALGVEESDQVLNLVERLREKGLPVLVISHNMQHIYRITDRIIVLRHGAKVADLRKSETTLEEVVGYITGVYTQSFEQLERVAS